MMTHQKLLTGKKNDILDNKDRWDLLSLSELKGIVKILTFGAKKYGENNWQLLENGWKRYQAAMMRHLVAIEEGEDIDSESGFPHIYHAFCNMYFLVHYYNKHTRENNR